MRVKLVIVDISNFVELAHASSIIKQGKVCFVYIDERGARKIELGELVEKDSGIYMQYAEPIPSSLYAYLREHKDMSEISGTGLDTSLTSPRRWCTVRV